MFCDAAVQRKPSLHFSPNLNYSDLCSWMKLFVNFTRRISAVNHPELGIAIAIAASCMCFFFCWGGFVFSSLDWLSYATR